jgi:hypothetical protein
VTRVAVGLVDRYDAAMVVIGLVMLGALALVLWILLTPPPVHQLITEGPVLRQP